MKENEEEAPTQRQQIGLMRALFLRTIDGWKDLAYTDGGPTDVGRQPRRRKAKAQRLARRKNRRG